MCLPFLIDCPASPFRPRRLPIASLCSQVQHSPCLRAALTEKRFLALGELLDFEIFEALAFLLNCSQFDDAEPSDLSDPLCCMLLIWQAIYEQRGFSDPLEYLHNALTVAKLDMLAKCLRGKSTSLSHPQLQFVFFCLCFVFQSLCLLDLQAFSTRN